MILKPKTPTKSKNTNRKTAVYIFFLKNLINGFIDYKSNTDERFV
jgi:hypothetical protein